MAEAASIRFAACLVVQGLRRHDEAARPCDRSGLGVNLDAREVACVFQRLEDAAPLASAEVDVTDGLVRKGEAQPVLADEFDVRDVDQLFH